MMASYKKMMLVPEGVVGSWTCDIKSQEEKQPALRLSQDTREEVVSALKAKDVDEASRAAVARYGYEREREIAHIIVEKFSVWGWRGRGEREREREREREIERAVCFLYNPAHHLKISTTAWLTIELAAHRFSKGDPCLMHVQLMENRYRANPPDVVGCHARQHRVMGVISYVGSLTWNWKMPLEG